MATKADVTASATAARTAVEEYYDQAILDVTAEASFWKNAVTSPLAALSETAITTATADAASTLDSLGVPLG